MPEALDYASPAQAASGSVVYAYVISAIAAVGGLLFGFDTAIIAGAIEFIRSEFHLQNAPLQEGFVVSSLLVGCIIGSSVAGVIADATGRKKVLITTAGLYVVSAILSALPHSVGGLTAARFMGGLAVGISSMVAPMYIAELAPARIRGRLVTLNQMAIVTGILLANLVSWLLVRWWPGDPHVWRWMFASAAVPAFVLLIALLMVPESPRWLASRSRDRESFHVLARINGPERAQAELEEIRAALSQEKGSFGELFSPGLRTALLIGVMLAALGQVSGINSIIYYAPKVFLQAGMIKTESAMLGNVLVGITNFVSTIISLWVIDKVGRKALLLLGTAGMTICLLVAGATLTKPDVPIPLKVAMILGYIAAFGIGVGGVVWVVIAEIFPNKVRGRGSSIATGAVWAACFVVAQTFPYLIGAYHEKVFWFYAVMAAAMFLFTWLVVPETKGRSLEEIELMWRSSEPRP